jgi:hypothetical protein
MKKDKLLNKDQLTTSPIKTSNLQKSSLLCATAAILPSCERLKMRQQDPNSH